MALTSALLCAGLAFGAPTTKPNLVFALVDDMGHTNVPWNNPEQTMTESLNKIATEEGVLLERFYTYKYCSPTRSSFLSGRFPIHVNEQNPFGVGVVGGIDLRMTLLPQKLKKLGYKTAMTGKWHCGARSNANLPINRGFDQHLGFLSGGEDHNTQRSYETGNYVDLWENHGPAYGKNGTNSCYLYGRKAVEYIEQHDTSSPLFLYLPFHDVHAPYEALPEYTDDSIPEVRRPIQGMVACVGDATYNVTEALKRKGMWNNTLFIWSSDNGGPQYWEGNNYPFRGGKGNDFEGGVRAAAFATGGLLHESLKGKSLTTPMHVADFWPSFCLMAGGSEEDCMHDRIPGLPDVDGTDVSRALLTGVGNTTRATDVVLSSNGFIEGNYKYVGKTTHESVCDKAGCGYWTGPKWPVSAAHIPVTQDPGCPADGCVFDLSVDAEERHDLSASDPALQQRLRAKMNAYVAGKFQTNSSGGYDNCVPLKQAAEEHHGFAVPLCT